MILAYRPPAEGSYPTEGVVVLELTDSQRAWLIHCVKSTHAPKDAEEVAVSCIAALGGQL